MYLFHLGISNNKPILWVFLEQVSGAPTISQLEHCLLLDQSTDPFSLALEKLSDRKDVSHCRVSDPPGDARS